MPLLVAAPKAPLALRIACPLIVAVAAFVAFQPALDAEFVQWDDDKVIYDNPYFRGFAASNIEWMFTQYKMGHYQPLTWLSYAVDHAISQSRFESAPDAVKARYKNGLDPKVFHLTNLLLHACVAVGFYFLAALLLRLFLPPPEDRRDFATPACAAAAALLFACHPLRVETVAWATERRDVLSSVFLIPCLLCYVRYAVSKQGSRAQLIYYIAAVVLLPVSLLAKAWGITLPAVMLVLDVYPLRRIGGRSGWLSSSAVRAYLDKIPFISSAIYFAVKAKDAQGTALDTLKSLDEWGYLDRISQAFYGLFFYVYKTVWPADLIPIVQIPPNNDPLAARYVVAAVLVVAAAVGLILLRKRWPAGIVAAVCYLAVISPVLGIAQSGPQLAADRYSYLACMPWALVVGAGLLWLARDGTKHERSRAMLPVAGVATCVAIVALAFLVRRQTRVWHDSRTLWEHTVEVDPQCVLARTNLGMLERQAGNVERAIEHYRAALAIDPDDYLLINNLAVAIRTDPTRIEEAIDLLRHAVELQPKHADLHYSLASALDEAGYTDEALAELAKCVKLKSGVAKYHRLFGTIYMRKHEWDAAEEHYKKALSIETRLDPRGLGVVNALDRLGRISLQKGLPDEAVRYFERILEIDPKNGDAKKWIAFIQSAH